MKGTQHFSRMSYHVKRGLREIVAPSHRISKSTWAVVLDEFSHRCAYCGSEATAENRGIVPDHLVAVTDYGELVLGNTVPACQTCNDSRGNKDWREFLQARFPVEALARVAAIEAYIKGHGYSACTPESALTQAELMEYNEILQQWESLLQRAQALQAKVSMRRKAAANKALKPSCPPTGGHVT
jgi:NMD protein affecting ribosome stability and mRNA decay